VEKNCGFTGKRGLNFGKIRGFLMIRGSKPAPTLNGGTIDIFEGEKTS
jgi:hypothetical protein